MNHAGDAAEQVVRMSLEGAEVALKITGVAAKNLAAALYTILKDQKKTKGKARIEAMLREKRPLKVYTLKKEDCPEFARQAKGYGILYAPIPVRKGDDTIDILVFEDDAARARRRAAGPGKSRPGKERGRQALRRADGKTSPKREKPAGKPLCGEKRPFYPSGGKIPSVRAYLREQQQVRKGYF